MSLYLRRVIPTGAINPSITASITRRLPSQWRTYAHSSYGGGDQNNAKQSQKTRNLEHPGPPPPDVGSSSSSSSSSDPRPPNNGSSATDSPDNKEPSNKAHPVITDGLQSDNVDSQGNTRQDVPSDVKQHNEEMTHRYDRSYNQVGGEGKGPR